MWQMKRAFASLTVAGALTFAGCADELEQPNSQEVGQRLERGFRGEGTLGPRDRSDDPYLRADNPSAPEPRPLPQTPPEPNP
jgi:hypothetical protein